MGVFDTIKFNCPDCKRSIEVQVKDCLAMFNTYSNMSVPIRLVSDPIGEKIKCSCGKRFTVGCSYETLPLFLIPEDYSDL